MRTLALLFCLTAAAVGATVTIEVASVGDYDAWVVIAAANKVVAVQSPEEYVTAIACTSANQYQSYVLAASGVPAGSTINYVIVRWTFAAAAVNCQAFLRIGTDNEFGPEHLLYYGEGFQPFSDTLDRPGGGSWAYSDLSGLEVGVNSTADGGAYNKYVTLLTVKVDYTAGAPPAPSDDNGFWGWLGD